MKEHANCSRTCSRTCSCSRTRTEQEHENFLILRTRTEQDKYFSGNNTAAWGYNMGSVQDHRRTLKIHITKCFQICTCFHEREIGWFDNDTDQSKLDTKFFILNFDPIKNEKSLPKNWDHQSDRDYATYDHVIQSNCTQLKNLLWLIMYD